MKPNLPLARSQIEQALGWVTHLERENGYDLHDIEGCLITAAECLTARPTTPESALALEEATREDPEPRDPELLAEDGVDI